MTEPRLILKTMPPRLPRGMLERDRLLPFWTSARECTAIAVVAPAGFGKTTLLLQWRRQWMEQGALVAWLGIDAQDKPMRFILALLQALRDASGRAAFDTFATRYGSESGQEVAMLTALLGEIALLGTETVLVLDDAERLPEPTVHDSLQYLLLNAPANLHVVIGSRSLLPMRTSELTAKGNLAVLGMEDLRLRLGESIEILRRRLGARLDVHQAAKLHEAVQGWPIGLQFAIARIGFEGDPAAAADALSARRGDLRDYFVEFLLSRLPAPDAGFLVRVAILDHLSVPLCEAVTGNPRAAGLLDWLARETPLMMMDGHEDWGRLHPLARDFLLDRFERLPRAEQVELHTRASGWFAEHGRFHQAACHALAIGDEARAHAYAMKSLWALGTQGRLAEAREWLERIPPRLLANDVSIKLAASWIFALGDRNGEALQIALEVADDPSGTPLRCMAALRVAGGAAIYADHLGLVPRVLARWPQATGQPEEPLYAIAPLNANAILALHSGACAEVRRLAAQAATYGNAGSLRLAAALAQVMVGLSHLWDGKPCQAEAVLHPALTLAERDEGRRGVVACVHAAVLATALLERGQPATAEALLANRLDVIESSFPDIILAAYLTLSRIAAGRGDERRALAALDGLDSLARHRQLPRLQMHGLAERIRIHTTGGRVETAGKLVADLDRLAPAFQHETLLVFAPQYLLTSAIAKAYMALARRELDETERQLRSADALAEQLHRGHDAQTIKVLRAVAARQRDPGGARALLSEAVGLANLGGNTRLLVDTHPLAVRMAEELQETIAGALPAPFAQAAMATPLPPAPPLSLVPVRQGLLTAKETEVLHLLDKGMSNKLIARTLDISSETVKWHLKNLFQKLSAGTRRHAVDRARLLGLVDS
jgi:LuxR family maltose regulon positive regulatory protein